MNVDSPARVIAAALAFAAWTSASTAVAQDLPREPIGRFSADVRVAIPRFPDDDATASALVVTTDNIPSRGLGVAAGINVYPLRLGRVSIGFGGEWLTSRGSKTLEPTTAGGASSPTVTTSVSVLSPQLSLNFGGRDGWSYVSGGIGLASFTTEREDAPVADADGRTRSFNYGGGARWFVKEHLAFCFDLRFYRINPQDAATGRPAYGGRRIMAFSAGISVK
jgi:Outer membrane protein beta-barrel domain